MITVFQLSQGNDGKKIQELLFDELWREAIRQMRSIDVSRCSENECSGRQRVIRAQTYHAKRLLPAVLCGFAQARGTSVSQNLDPLALNCGLLFIVHYEMEWLGLWSHSPVVCLVSSPHRCRTHGPIQQLPLSIIV